MRLSRFAYLTALLFSACTESSPKEETLLEREQALSFTNPEVIMSGADIRTMKCMDALNAGTSNGTAVVLYHCHGGPNQRWTARSDDTVQVKTGRCLTVDGAIANGATVKLQDCTGAANQSWSWNDRVDALTWPLLKLEGTSKCLMPQGGSLANFTPLVLADCDTVESQSWVHYPVVTVRSVASNRCLDVNLGTGIGNGSQVQIYDCHGGANQRWLLTRYGELVELTSSRCLDVSGGVMTSGTNVQIWDCNNQSNQDWSNAIVPPAVGFQLLANSVHSNLCLDVKGGLTANFTPVQIWSCHGGSNQQWTYDYVN